MVIIWYRIVPAAGVFYSNKQPFRPLFYMSSLTHTLRKILALPSILLTSLTIPITFLHTPLSLTLRILPYIINCAVICITLNHIIALPNVISEHSHHREWGCFLLFSLLNTFMKITPKIHTKSRTHFSIFWKSWKYPSRFAFNYFHKRH